MRLLRRMPMLAFFYGSLYRYPAPPNLSYFWNFGVYSIICLVIQLLTGLILAMHYVPHTDYAFHSVESIMREVSGGWVFRFIHANGASMFFIAVYCHIFRNLYYGSYVYPRQSIWYAGILLLVAMIVTAFLGYVLPWGQMSFWGATVITNLFTAVPVFGTKLLMTLWGGYSITSATLVRFYALHFILPFVILTITTVHIYLLHLVTSNNPLGPLFYNDMAWFFPYTIKDFYGTIVFCIFVAIFVYFFPNYLGHPDNYIEADPLQTPAHIVPEWYFLLFYAILRSIPDKLLGIVTLVLAILALGLLPLYSNPTTRSADVRPYSRYVVYAFVFVCFLLTDIGGRSIEYPYVLIGQILTFLYFFLLIVVLPSVERFEHFLYKKQFKGQPKELQDTNKSNEIMK